MKDNKPKASSYIEPIKKESHMDIDDSVSVTRIIEEGDVVDDMPHENLSHLESSKGFDAITSKAKRHLVESTKPEFQPPKKVNVDAFFKEDNITKKRKDELPKVSQRIRNVMLNTYGTEDESTVVEYDREYYDRQIREAEEGVS